MVILYRGFKKKKRTTFVNDVGLDPTQLSELDNTPAAVVSWGGATASSLLKRVLFSLSFCRSFTPSLCFSLPLSLLFATSRLMAAAAKVVVVVVQVRSRF